MASAIATIARVSAAVSACFGTDSPTPAAGQRPMTLGALAAYVSALRELLAADDRDRWQARAPRAPPVWPLPARATFPVAQLFGPKGGRPRRSGCRRNHRQPPPDLRRPSSVGTVLDPGEDPQSLGSVQPSARGASSTGHKAYATGGASAVDHSPGPRTREALESSPLKANAHLLTSKATSLISPNATAAPAPRRRQSGRWDRGERKSSPHGSHGWRAPYREIHLHPHRTDVVRVACFGRGAHHAHDPQT